MPEVTLYYNFDLDYTEPEPQPQQIIFQKEIKQNVHSISYLIPDLDIQNHTLKIEYLQKNKNNLLLFEGTFSEYNQIISKLFKKEISNEIIISQNRNLKLDKSNYLLITISGIFPAGSSPELSSIFKINTLFENYGKPLIISKFQLTENQIYSGLYNKFLLLDYTKVTLIESKSNLKNIENDFINSVLSVHSDYFINTQNNFINLFENQTLKVTANDYSNLYYYLIKI